MAVASQKLTLRQTLILLSLCVQVAWTQRLPPNNCDDVFHYERQGDQWIGRVTSSQLGLKSVDWTVTFETHGTTQSGTISGLAAYPDEQSAFNGGRAECFVKFDGYWTELPKISYIELNGAVLCSDSDYEPPFAKITRKLYLSITTKTHYQTLDPGSSSGSFANIDNIANLANTGDFKGLIDIANNIANNAFKPAYTTTTPPPAYLTRRPLVSFTRPSYMVQPTVTTPKPLLFINQKVTTTGKLNSPTASPAPSFIPVKNNYERNPFLPTFTSRRPPTTTVKTRPDPTFDECGVEGFTGLQIGGELVPRGRFPWLAALYQDNSLDPLRIDLSYKCVTSLVSKRTVITAAHCIYGNAPAELKVYVGRHDNAMNPEKDATLMAVQSVHTHPDFVGNLVPDSDLGLLVLVEPVQYTNFVRPICLWTSSTSLGIDDSEQTAVAGWGIDKEFKPTRFPMTVNVKPVSREECFREMVSAKDFLTPRTLCAGNSQGHGPCLGDSGGGLMVLRNRRWMVRGIVSLAQRSGNGCDLSRYVIYCDVARHLNWIERNVV